MTTAILPRATLDYTDRDFFSLKLRLQGLIQSVFPQWTDFNVANFGNILLELLCHVGDVVGYYQDNQALEAFWPTAQQRQSAIMLGRLIDFVLSGPTAATGTISITLDAPATQKISIAVGHRFSTEDAQNPQAFQATAAAEIAVGQSTCDVTVENSETRTHTADASDEPNQIVSLPNTPYLDGSLLVAAANGSYTVARSFLGAKSTDRVCVVTVDQYDAAHVRFGNGMSGAMPTGEIAFTYKTGGGLAGRVEAGTITRAVDSVVDALGATHYPTITNTNACSGGADRMSLAESRALGPASLRVLSRTVSKLDFEDGAKMTRGVARALMATSNELSYIAENTGILYVVAQGPVLASGAMSYGVPSQAMLDEIYADIVGNRPPTITFSFECRATTFWPIAVASRVHLRMGYDPTAVGNQIRAALADLFAVSVIDPETEELVDNPIVDFGVNIRTATGGQASEFAWGDVYNAIRDVPGVRKIDDGGAGLLLNNQRQSAALQPHWFPVLGSVGLVDAVTGSAI